MKLFQEKIDLLADQLFSALDKEIKRNEIRVNAKNGGITCTITIKTAPHNEPPVFILEEEGVSQSDNEEATQMFK